MSEDTGPTADRDAPVGSPERDAWQRQENERSRKVVDAVGGAKSESAVPLYAISEAALDDLEAIILGEVTSDNREVGLGIVRDARRNGAINPGLGIEGVKLMADEHDRAVRQRALAEQQRDFLVGQVDSLIQRLAGAHVAAGSFNMAAAQGFTQKEVMPINAVLAQITNVPGPDAGP